MQDIQNQFDKNTKSSEMSKKQERNNSSENNE